MSNIVMFKSQLQEYAQKASIAMPAYETTREGAPHSPKYKAAVIVNGVRYNSPSNFRNLKAAEHAAAQVALEDLLKKTIGKEFSLNPLEYAQKASIAMPAYETTREGAPHSPKYKAAVIVNGVRYDSPSNFRNLNAAEHAAAQVALEDLLKKTIGKEFALNPLHDTGLCKNLLRVYEQKMSLPLPSYCCKGSGNIHLPTFICIVEVSRVQYTGGVAHSRKEAEIKAARTALLALPAQACDSNNEVAVASISASGAAISSQLEFYPRKRDREVEMLSEEHESVKTKQETNSSNSTGKYEMPEENNSRKDENSQVLLTVKDSQLAPLKEPEKPFQQESYEMQQEKYQVEGEVPIETEEEGSEKLQHEQQIPQEVNLKKRKKGGKGNNVVSKSKNQRRKKTRNEGKQKNFSTTQATC